MSARPGIVGAFILGAIGLAHTVERDGAPTSSPATELAEEDAGMERPREHASSAEEQGAGYRRTLNSADRAARQAEALPDYLDTRDILTRRRRPRCAQRVPLDGPSDFRWA